MGGDLRHGRRWAHAASTAPADDGTVEDGVVRPPPTGAKAERWQAGGWGEPAPGPGPSAASMLQGMVSVRSFDVGRMLEAAESESPVEAAEAVARELGAVFDAAAVSFLILDLSGRALVRLAHVPPAGSSDDVGTPLRR